MLKNIRVSSISKTKKHDPQIKRYSDNEQFWTFFYKDNFIRTSRLKIAKIKNQLRTTSVSELLAQGKI